MMTFEKISLLVKPCQSGKTWEVMKQVSELDDNVISIFFTDNSLLQSTQLKSRMDNFDGIGDGTTLILSSQSKCKNTNELPTHILTKGIKNIIACSNSTRVKNMDVLFNVWNIFDPNETKRFNIYIDEADRMINMMRPYIEQWEENECINGVVLITATPHNILRDLGDLKIVKLEETYDPNSYHRFQDSEFRIYEFKKNDRCYIDKVLTQAKDNNDINDGNIFYFPGNVKKVSHYNIKNKCLGYGFNVITINSDGCKLYNDCENPTKFEKINTTGQEISKVLADLYTTKNLNNKPLAITGSTCIGRGVTISTPIMMITHAVLPPSYTNISNLYQSGGRLANNYKQNALFKKPVVYCTNRVKASICLSEERSCKIAVKSKRFNINKISIDDYKMSNKKYNIETRVFDSLDKVHKFLDRLLGDRVRKTLDVQDIDGVYINNLVACKKIEDLTIDDRLTKEKFDAFPPNYRFRENVPYRVFPVYENEEYVEDCLFYVRFKIV